MKSTRPPHQLQPFFYISISRHRSIMPTFMELPREIRDEVYIQYFATLPDRSTIQFEQETPTEPSDEWQPYGEDGNYFLHRSISQIGSVNLFLANKQVHAEASAALTRIFPPATNPSYAMHICIGTPSRVSWLHLPFLHPKVDTLHIWLTIPSATYLTGDGPDRIRNTLLDTLERCIMRGPDVPAVHGDMGIPTRQKQVSDHKIELPGLFYIHKIRVHVRAVGAGANAASMGKMLAEQINNENEALMHLFYHTSAMPPCRKSDEELWRFVLIFCGSDGLEIVWGSDEVREEVEESVLEWEEMKRYLFEFD